MNNKPISQRDIQASRKRSRLRLPFLTVIPALLGQLFIAGCGGSNSSGEIAGKESALDTAPSIATVAAATLLGDPTITFEFPTAGADVPAVQDIMVDVSASDEGSIQEVRLWLKKTVIPGFRNGTSVGISHALCPSAEQTEPSNRVHWLGNSMSHQHVQQVLSPVAGTR